MFVTWFLLGSLEGMEKEEEQRKRRVEWDVTESGNVSCECVGV